jgi:hypothetical protein
MKMLMHYFGEKKIARNKKPGDVESFFNNLFTQRKQSHRYFLSFVLK